MLKLQTSSCHITNDMMEVDTRTDYLEKISHILHGLLQWRILLTQCHQTGVIVKLCHGQYVWMKSVNYPHLKKQASEEDSLKIQASSPQALSFPAYPGDILRHVCKRDPVARQATPVFHR